MDGMLKMDSNINYQIVKVNEYILSKLVLPMLCGPSICGNNSIIRYE